MWCSHGATSCWQRWHHWGCYPAPGATFPQGFQEQGRTAPRPLHSITSSPAKHLCLLGGELGTAPRGQGICAAPGLDPTCCGPAQGSEQGAWQGFPAELLEGGGVLCQISFLAVCAFCCPCAVEERQGGEPKLSLALNSLAGQQIVPIPVPCCVEVQPLGSITHTLEWGFV